MTSSQPRTVNYSRRFAWLTAFIVILFGGYSAGWFYVAGEIEARVRSEIARFADGRRSVECVNLSVRGFPFRIGLWCDGVRLFDPAEGVDVSADRLRTVAQVYNPFHVVAEADSPASVELPGVDRLALTWEALRASIRVDFDFPERLSVETRGFKADFDAGPAWVSADAGEGHMRRRDQDLDLAGSLTAAKAAPELLDGGALPPLDTAVDMTIEKGVLYLRQGARSLRGFSGEIRNLSIASGPKTSLALAGFFLIASDGLLDADLKVKVRDPEAISDILENLFPKARERIAESLAGLKALGEEAEVPLKIEAGKVTLGFLPLGEIPPLK